MSALFPSEVDFNAVDLDAYCHRVGYHGPREATLAVLRALHRLHPAAIPFETLDVRLGLGVELDPAIVDAKLIHGRRGGYCFEQNTLFLRVLRGLGFDAEPLLGRSRWGRPLTSFQPRTHMAVRVRLEGEAWLADVGFGGSMLTAPLRLNRRGAQRTRHEPARLTPAGDELRLERLIGGAWTTVYDLCLVSQEPVDLLAANWLICTHPDSPFRHRLVVSQASDEERRVLVDARLTIRRADGGAKHQDLDADGIAQCLAEDFGLAASPSWRPLFDKIAAEARLAGS